MSGESVQISAVSLRLNIADGQQAIHRDKIGSANLIQSSRFLCECDGVSVKACGKFLKEGLEVWKEGSSAVASAVVRVWFIRCR